MLSVILRRPRKARASKDESADTPTEIGLSDFGTF